MTVINTEKMETVKSIIITVLGHSQGIHPV